MKNINLILFLGIFIISCTSDKETIEMDNFLKSFNLNINDYKVICFVPVDGCGTCIDPSLNYARDARKDYLLVMSSMYRKSIDITAERIQIYDHNYVADYANLSMKKGLVTPFSPCYYFLRYGKVIRKLDLNQTNNKSGIIGEVEQFFIEEDANIEKMEKTK